MARVVYTVTYWHGMHYVPADSRRFVGTKFRCEGLMDLVSNPNRKLADTPALRRSAAWCWGRIGGVTPSKDQRAGLETIMDRGF
jgi:hypothetical protein